MIISKELLSEILGYEVTEIYNVDNTLLYYGTSDMAIHMKFSPYKCNVNIHELAHKCKEWAYDKHDAVINMFQKTSYQPYVAKVNGICFSAGTEPEAIFKACQWILDNKDNQ